MKSPTLIIIREILIILPCMLTVEVSFAAISDAEFLACSSLKDTDQKIQCFDAPARTLSLQENEVVASQIDELGKWGVSVETDLIDDSALVILSLPAESKNNTLLNRSPFLSIRCKRNELDLIIVWWSYLRREAKVTTRVGKEVAVERHWSLSTDGQATFLHGDVSGFVDSLLNHDTLVAQTTPYNKGTLTAIFHTQRLGNAIQTLRTASN